MLDVVLLQQYRKTKIYSSQNFLPLQETLDVSVVESSLEDELTLPSESSVATQLSKHKRGNVIGTTVHTFADIEEVNPGSLFGRATGDLVNSTILVLEFGVIICQTH